MQPPAGIDVSLIREALARRAAGGLGGGTTLPVVQQVSVPGGALPTGGPNVSVPQPAPQPPAQPNQLPAQNRQMPASSATPAQSAANVAQLAQGMPDDETRKIAKALLGKLVQFL